MLVTTRNSVYELDSDHRRIRRVSGDVAPTPAFDPEGEWKDYHEVTGFEVGSPVATVHWGTGGYTRLSRVLGITERLF
ncbi:MAG TPA: hypothetical protein VE990_12460 [Acidimicrobiales bacterium]|nr:hypothetical protein [Acidimicrobiales bacterium]